MKINIHSINPTLVLEVTGNEAWLKNIYAEYQRHGEGRKPLTGSIKLHEEEAGTYLVTGELAMTAVLPCDLCERGLAMPVKMTLNTRYLPGLTNTIEKEKNLSRSDLDAYYIEDEQIDLEELLNDSINDTLPTRLTCPPKDGLTCTGKDVKDDRAWSSRDEKDSPFAALKGLKLRN
jgi:uncharacterized metal-binding protein YceD (DUF177 family)